MMGDEGARGVRDLSIYVAAIALILATFQAMLSWGARDDHIEAITRAAVLDTCAEVGSEAAQFMAKADPVLKGAKGRGASADSIQVLQAAPRDIGRVYYKASYMLPAETAAELDRMWQAAQRAAGDAPKNDAVELEKHLKTFEAASIKVQEACRKAVRGK